MNFDQSSDDEAIEEQASAAPDPKPYFEEAAAAKPLQFGGPNIKYTKHPESTLRILSVEKALFKALKAKANKTPKYDLLYYQELSAASNAGVKKGKISKMLELKKKAAMEQNIE